MSDVENKYHWWLVSHAWFGPDGKQGYGNYTHGTTLKVFDNGAHEYAKEHIKKIVNTSEFVLTSISYLGDMTRLVATGEE